jgi:hypothetical protein
MLVFIFERYFGTGQDSVFAVSTSSSSDYGDRWNEPSLSALVLFLDGRAESFFLTFGAFGRL